MCQHSWAFFYSGMPIPIYCAARNLCGLQFHDWANRLSACGRWEIFEQLNTGRLLHPKSFSRYTHSCNQ